MSVTHIGESIPPVTRIYQDCPKGSKYNNACYQSVIADLLTLSNLLWLVWGSNTGDNDNLATIIITQKKNLIMQVADKKNNIINNQ